MNSLTDQLVAALFLLEDLEDCLIEVAPEIPEGETSRLRASIRRLRGSATGVLLGLRPELAAGTSRAEH